MQQYPSQLTQGKECLVQLPLQWQFYFIIKRSTRTVAEGMCTGHKLIQQHLRQICDVISGRTSMTAADYAGFLLSCSAVTPWSRGALVGTVRWDSLIGRAGCPQLATRSHWDVLLSKCGINLPEKLVSPENTLQKHKPGTNSSVHSAGTPTFPQPGDRAWLAADKTQAGRVSSTVPQVLMAWTHWMQVRIPGPLEDLPATGKVFVYTLFLRTAQGYGHCPLWAYKWLGPSQWPGHTHCAIKPERVEGPSLLFFIKA